MYQPPQPHVPTQPGPMPPMVPQPPQRPWSPLTWGLLLLLPLTGAVLLLLAAFVPWLRVQYGAQDALSSYHYPGSYIATSHLTSMSLDGLSFWLTLIYAALLAGLAIAGLRAVTGWGMPTLTAKRLLVVSGFATLLMVHALFACVSDLLDVDSVAGSGMYSDRFNPGLGLFVGPLGALLALVGASVALRWTTRGARAGVWPLVAEAPAPLVPAIVYGILSAGAESIVWALLGRWRAVLTHPTRASFEPAVAGAGWSGAVANVGALVGVQVFVSLLCGTLSFGEVATDAVMTPVAFFLLAGALFLAARVLGGGGELAAHMTGVAVGWAPAAALSSVALAVGVPFVSGLASVAFGGYGIFLAVLAMLTAHRIGGHQVAHPTRMVAGASLLMSPSAQPAPTQPSMPPQAQAPMPMPDPATVSQGAPPPSPTAMHVCAAGHPVYDASAQLCRQCGAAMESAPLEV